MTNLSEMRLRLAMAACGLVIAACGLALAAESATPTFQTTTAGQSVNVARYVTNIVTSSSSRWERVDANLPDQVYYKLALESVVVTGGVRHTEIKDYYINVSVTNYTTNVVFYTPYRELDRQVFIKVAPPQITPPDFLEVVEQTLPRVTLRDLQPPKVVKPEIQIPAATVVGDYVDYVNYGALSHDYSSLDEGGVLSDTLSVNDPIEPFNRAMFAANDYIYNYFVGPFCKGYRFIVPTAARVCIARMDHNLVWPKRLINNLLQAKFKGAGVETSRFLINTTVGLAGMFDPAEAWMDLQKYDEDTGQTFGTWGIGPGCYVFLPLAGPLTARDTVGMIFDEAMDPRTYVPCGGLAKTFMVMNNISLQVDTLDSLYIDNGDPYAFARDMWYLKRAAEIDE